MKCWLMLVASLAVAVALPAPFNEFNRNDDLMLKSGSDKGKGTDTSTKGPGSQTTESSESAFKKFLEEVGIDLLSIGKLGANPATGGDLGGELYHKLSFSFGPDKAYEIYLDHLLKADSFDESNGGVLSLGYDSPIPYVGDVSVRASQGLGNAGKAGFDWRFNFNDAAILSELS